MRVTYFTKEVWKPAVWFFLYWNFLKVSGSFYVSEKKSWNFKYFSKLNIHLLFLGSLQLEQQSYSVCTVPTVQLPHRQQCSRSVEFGSNWCLPGWALRKGPSTLISCSLLCEWSCSLNFYFFLSGGQIPALPRPEGGSPHFVAEVLPQRLMGSWQSFCRLHCSHEVAKKKA